MQVSKGPFFPSTGSSEQRSINFSVPNVVALFIDPTNVIAFLHELVVSKKKEKLIEMTIEGLVT